MGFRESSVNNADKSETAPSGRDSHLRYAEMLIFRESCKFPHRFYSLLMMTVGLEWQVKIADCSQSAKGIASARPNSAHVE
jgi:hypothetical protein